MWHPTEGQYTLAGVIVSVGMGWYNSRKIRDVHVIMNSRLTQLLKSSNEAAAAKGHAEGMKEERSNVRS